MNLIPVFARGGEIYSNIGDQHWDCSLVRAEQRAVLAFLFAVCFRKNRPKFLKTSLQVYVWSHKREMKKEQGDQISCVV